MSRFARHKDTAHRPTVLALKAAGASVEAMDLKDGPDLLVGYKGATLLMEVKTRSEREEKDGYTRTRLGQLSPGQQTWHEGWKGGRVLTVYGPEDALIGLGVDMHAISQLKVLTGGWKKDVAPKVKAPTKARPFRPGKDKARTLSEMCKWDFCTTSAVPGTVPPRCAAHAAEETFAPGPIETLTLLPKGGALRSPPRSGAKAGDPRYFEFVPAIHGVDVRVVLSFGDKTMDVTGYSDEEMAEAAARLINVEPFARAPVCIACGGTLETCTCRRKP